MLCGMYTRVHAVRERKKKDRREQSLQQRQPLCPQRPLKTKERRKAELE